MTGTFSKHCLFPARNGLSFRFLFSSLRTNYKEDSPPPPRPEIKNPPFETQPFILRFLKVSLASGKHQFLVIEPKISALSSKTILRRRGLIYRITS